ncbi:hypothetical protein EDC01DRAFT_761457 [Geopyxis carbonaria]|nr:hypothetical protein EDC01DRAFT_761457 [Geopyxis carbonaria]
MADEPLASKPRSPRLPPQPIFDPTPPECVESYSDLEVAKGAIRSSSMEGLQLRTVYIDNATPTSPERRFLGIILRPWMLVVLATAVVSLLTMSIILGVMLSRNQAANSGTAANTGSTETSTITPSSTNSTADADDFGALTAVWSPAYNATAIFTPSANTLRLKYAHPSTPLAAVGTPSNSTLLYLSASHDQILAHTPATGRTRTIASSLDLHALTSLSASSADTGQSFFIYYQASNTSLHELSHHGESTGRTLPDAAPGSPLSATAWPIPTGGHGFRIYSLNAAGCLVDTGRNDRTAFSDMAAVERCFATPRAALACTGWHMRGRTQFEMRCYAAARDGRVQLLAFRGGENKWRPGATEPERTLADSPYLAHGARTPLVAAEWWLTDITEGNRTGARVAFEAKGVPERLQVLGYLSETASSNSERNYRKLVDVDVELK